MNENKEITELNQHKNEIDFMVLLNKIWGGRKIIIICVSAGIVLGLMIALLSPKSFKVITTMLPQSESESGLGKFSSLAAIAGFDLNLGTSSTEISPVVYPQIVQSEIFLAELMYSKFSFSKVDHPVSIFDYYTKIKKPGILEIVQKYTIGLPVLIKMSMKKSGSIKKNDCGIPSFTEDEENLLIFLKSNVTLVVNKKEGYLTLTCIMPEALLAAQVAEKAQKLLQKTITEYKTQSSTEQLVFIEQRYKEKKDDYQKVQDRLAFFRDRNQNVSTAAAKTELDRLQGEYDIAYSVYSELAKSLEQTKIQVKRQTPVFAIIKPVVVPREKFKPKRSIILLMWTLIGGIAGLGIVFGKKYYLIIKNKSKNDLVG